MFKQLFVCLVSIKVFFNYASEFLICLSGPESGEEARILGLAMIPGRHIVSIDIDAHVSEVKNEDKPLSSFKLESIA